MTSQVVPTEPLNEFSRLSGIFFRPKQAFADIVERPRWIVPVILIIIASLCLIFLFSQHVGFDRLIRQSLDQSSRAQSMTAEQRDQAMRMGMKFGQVMAYVSSVIAPPVSVLVVGAVLMSIFNGMLGCQIRFGQMTAITAYSFLPGLVSAILAIVVMFTKSPEDFDLRNPLAFNVGAFLTAETTPKWLMSLATSIDLFSFWTIGLLATGIVVASPKLSWSKAFIAVLVPWALVVFLKAGWAGLFG